MADPPRTILNAVEEAVPSTWDVKTGSANGKPALWARSPNRRWQIEAVKNPLANTGSYNVELHKMDGRGQGVAGLYNGTTVQFGDRAAQAVADFIEDATGSYRGRRHERPRSGDVQDDAGLFDGLF